MKKKFNVTGMTCSACSSRVEKSIRNLSGVQNASVNLLTNSMQVTFDGDKLKDSDIVNAVRSAGYDAFSAEQEKPAGEKPAAGDETRQMKQRLILSFAFLIPLMYLAMYHMFYEWFGLPVPALIHNAFHGEKNALTYALTQFLLLLPILFINRRYFSSGFRALAGRSPNMDSLIAIGSGAATVYGVFALFRMSYALGHGASGLLEQYAGDLYFESAATILTLITLGKFLEAKSKGKTGEAIRRLMDLSPKTALVQREGGETEIPVEDVLTGDILIIKPGGAIPVDGIVTEGESSVDESAITGESIPVHKSVNDTVTSATVNKNGYFKFRATKVGKDTTIFKIIELVEEAASSKAPISKLADKISGIFVPIVIAVAVLSAAVWLLTGATFEFALSIGISVLVISCPCALGLATPVAIMVGTGKGAENGILIKSGEALETAHEISTVVLDKTGTVTEGKPVVTDLLPVGIGEEELLEIAASLENNSEHPLAEAILSYAKERNIRLSPTSAFRSLSGKGISAKIGEREYRAGNLALMRENRIDTAGMEPALQKLSDEGKTPLIFSDDAAILGVIAVADTVKPTSIQAVKALKGMGIDVIMLTGDNRRTAEAIRGQLGIGRVVAEVLPQDKEKEIAALQSAGHKTAMIGDGINDAPALTRADLGIAIGAGTDVAIESAQIILVRSDLDDAVTAIKLSRAVMRNIKENLFWAFFYNAVGIPLAAGVFYGFLGWKLSPMFAAAAMSMSSVCVVLNALRLKFFRGSARAEQNMKKGTVNSMQDKVEIKIEGMSCGHCTNRVETMLNKLEGVSAKVSLADKTAYLELSGEVSDEILKKTVEDAGYEVVGLSRR